MSQVPPVAQPTQNPTQTQPATQITHQTENSVAQPTIPSQLKSKKRIILLLLGLTFLIILGTIASFILSSRHSKTEKQATSSIAQPSPTTKATPIPITVPASSISGSLKLLNKDLQLLSDVGFPVTYYEAGTFNSGKYSGYTRIVAIYEAAVPGGSSCGDSVFLTKDNIHYIGNSDEYSITSGSYNKNKVTETAAIDYSIPSAIQLDNNFSLFLYSYGWLSFKNRNSNPPDCTLNSSSDKNIALLSSPTDYNMYYINSLSNSIIAPDASVIIIDKAGLPFEYLLSEKESFKYLAGTGPGQYTTGTENIFDYNDGGLRDSKFKNPDNFYAYEPGFNTTYPDYPRFIPDFSSLKASDFTQAENINGNIPIYILSDSAAASIYQTRYQKISGIAQTYVGKPTTYFGRDYTFHKPTYAQYVQKHPFIFIKDYFERFVLFEEVNYQTWHDPTAAG